MSICLRLCKFQVSPSYHNMTDYDAVPNIDDTELQDFVRLEAQKAQVYAQIHEFNEICWNKCVGKPGSKLDSSTEACLSNCVDRFIDTSLLITNRFGQKLQQQASSGF